MLGLTLVADTMALVVRHDALGADVDVIILAKVLRLLVGMLCTKPFLGHLFVFLLFFLLGHVLLAV